MRALWQGFLSWGWMAAGGLVLLAGFMRVVGFRVKKARAYMKEHPGVIGRLVFTVTMVSVILGGAIFCIGNVIEAGEAALNDDLPGAWKVLYDSMGEMEGYVNQEARLLTLGVFLENAEDLPSLGLTGFTRIVNQAFSDSSAMGQSVPLTDMLKKFVTITAPEVP
jgi:hypothetical protein